MVRLAAVCTALFSCLAFAPTPAHTATSHHLPPYFTVHLISANGSGCPAGSTEVSQASDTTFTVTYDQYTAAAGDGTLPQNSRKNCQLNVQVGVPSGWTFGITSVDYRGYARLGPVGYGTLAASYYYAGLPTTYGQNHPISGPMDDDYAFNDLAPVVAYAPCHFDTTLNINTELRAYTGSDQSYFNMITMDSTDVSASTLYRLTFEEC